MNKILLRSLIFFFSISVMFGFISVAKAFQISQISQILEILISSGFIPTENVENARMIVQQLESSSGTTYNYIRDLGVGSSGPDVVALQDELIQRGYLIMPAGVPKGYFGDLTRNALVRYQTDNNISPASGYFGSATRSFFQSGNLNYNNFIQNQNQNQNQFVPTVASCGIATERQYKSINEISSTELCGLGSVLDTSQNIGQFNSGQNIYFSWRCVSTTNSASIQTCFANQEKEPIDYRMYQNNNFGSELCGSAHKRTYWTKSSLLSSGQYCASGSVLSTVDSGTIEEFNSGRRTFFWWQCKNPDEEYGLLSTCLAYRRYYNSSLPAEGGTFNTNVSEDDLRLESIERILD